MTFRFIGSEANIGDKRLEKFGEPVEFPESQGAVLIVGNVAIIPAAEFQACGFTMDELEMYAYPGPRIDATPEFSAKWKQARIALHETRERLKNGGPLVAQEV